MSRKKSDIVIKKPFHVRLKKDLQTNGSLYILVLPVIIFFIIFHYIPLWGAQIAFRDYTPKLGITGSRWVGVDHFVRFFKSPNFTRTIKNTFTISILELIFAFPAPILLALLLNELRWPRYKKAVQTITYLPHFISLVVICGMIKDFVSTYGFFNDIREFFGLERFNWLQDANYFRPIYIISGIWAGIGWGSIIYIAALAGIDQELYEAASIDGANRFQKAIHITLASLVPTIIIMLIMRLGQMFSVGYEKIILLYNPATYRTADVISTYVYRSGLIDRNFSYSTAVGLFNSLINFLLVLLANTMSRKLTQLSLW